MVRIAGVMPRAASGTVFRLFESIFKYVKDLLRYLEDLEEGVYIQVPHDAHGTRQPGAQPGFLPPWPPPTGKGHEGYSSTPGLGAAGRMAPPARPCVAGYFGKGAYSEY
jgi:hypothetical protein